MQAEDLGGQERFGSVPVLLFLIGFVLIFTGILVLIIASALLGDVDISGGGIVFIGPIPIVFGAGPNAFLAIVLAAVLTIIGFIVFLWLRRTEA